MAEERAAPPAEAEAASEEEDSGAEEETMPSDVKELQLLLTQARGKILDAENELAFLRANEHRLREENAHLHERADRLSLELIESVSFSVRVTLSLSFVY